MSDDVECCPYQLKNKYKKFINTDNKFDTVSYTSEDKDDDNGGSRFVYWNILVAILIIIVIYGIIYTILGYMGHLNNFNSFIDGLYFSVTTITTIGFGDVTPKTTLAKIVVMTQQAVTILFFVLLCFASWRFKMGKIKMDYRIFTAGSVLHRWRFKMPILLNKIKIQGLPVSGRVNYDFVKTHISAQYGYFLNYSFLVNIFELRWMNYYFFCKTFLQLGRILYVKVDIDEMPKY